MTEKPLVSVIINCYNGEKYLREAIDSVIAQTYENWELVFWDNQSTDSTCSIVESYKDPRIHYFYAPKHTPLGEARNLAVEKANGEYINFLDADDVWSANKLAEQVKLIDPVKVGVIFTPLCIILEKEQKLYKKMYRYFLYLEKYSYENNDVLHKVLDKETLDIIELVKASGARKSCLTGSGSSIIGIYEDSKSLEKSFSILKQELKDTYTIEKAFSTEK